MRRVASPGRVPSSTLGVSPERSGTIAGSQRCFEDDRLGQAGQTWDQETKAAKAAAKQQGILLACQALGLVSLVTSGDEKITFLKALHTS